MNVLVDTSVWVAHLKQRNEHLAALLEHGRVVCHPYVVERTGRLGETFLLLN
jgi:predicted nucleic acid-binding protein